MAIFGPECRLRASRCPYCHTLLDATAGIGNAEMPVAGDFTVCIGCGQILVFDDALCVAKPRPGQFEEACRVDPLFGEMMKSAAQWVRQDHGPMNRADRRRTKRANRQRR